MGTPAGRTGLLMAAMALLGLCSPIMVFPNLLPESLQLRVITVLTGVTFAAAVALLYQWRTIRLPLWILLGAVTASWALMSTHDEGGLRHVAGVGFGVLTMAVVARWCTTTSRLIVTVVCVALGAASILTIGVLSTSIDVVKFSAPQDSLPTQVVVAPRINLDLPGMPPSREVNGNALGGTALLVLPLCAALATAGFLSRRLPMAKIVGGIATTIALAVWVLSLSRTAWIAGILTLVVWGVGWRRGRRQVFLALLLLIGLLSVGALAWRITSPVSFAGVLASTSHTAVIRGSVWMDAFDRLREHPWLGIGISQFHEVPRTTAKLGARMLVPHAHNIFVQVALDIGVIGLLGYVWLVGALLAMAYRAAQGTAPTSQLAAGAGLAVVAVHLFGIGDAIALGAKVGVFQWVGFGLILAAATLANDSKFRTDIGGQP